MTILIVGGDSQLAKEFVKLEKDKVILTTRREKSDDIKQTNCIYLDLLSVDDFKIPDKVDKAIIMGGVTSYNECMNNYDYAYSINCVSIPKLVKKLLNNDIFTCFVSSNTVFQSQEKIPNEHSIPNPGFEYARMKLETGSKITNISVSLRKCHLLSIFRMTKNVSCSTSPFNQWISDIRNNKEITAFKDLFFSPIRFEDSTRALSKIINNRFPGVYHISGEKDINYSDFAVAFLDYLGKDNNVKAILSTDVGVNLVYNHHITALSMKYSKKDIGFDKIQLKYIYSYFQYCLEEVK